MIFLFKLNSVKYNFKHHESVSKLKYHHHNLIKCLIFKQQLK